MRPPPAAAAFKEASLTPDMLGVCLGGMGLVPKRKGRRKREILVMTD